jgi:hypothetical protein
MVHLFPLGALLTYFNIHTTAIRDLKTTAYTFNLVGLIEAINAGAITVGRRRYA